MCMCEFLHTYVIWWSIKKIIKKILILELVNQKSVFFMKIHGEHKFQKLNISNIDKMPTGWVAGNPGSIQLYMYDIYDFP